MFSQLPTTSLSRVRFVWIAMIVGLFASVAATAPAEATTVSSSAPGEAFIASASGTTIETTSGSSATAASTGRSSAGSSGALTLNSGAPTTTASTAKPAQKTSSGTQIGESDLTSPTIVSSTTRRAAPAPERAELAQIQSGGPIVASSGTPVIATRHSANRDAAKTNGGSIARRKVTADARKPTSTLEVNAPGVHFSIIPTAAKRPAPAPAASRRPAAGPTVGQVSPAGSSGATGLVPTNPHPSPVPGGPPNTTLFGSGSGSAGGSALLGIDALFTIAVLLVGAAWRRRPWDLPVLPRQSALLCLAIDRPG
jgi:hypothetical protein